MHVFHKNDFALSNGFWAHSPSVALLAFHNEITGFLIAYTTTNAGKITERSGLLFESIFAVR
ncbi:hypothetical protein, partial [Escherichia coli]|uniref:hypothetical protein n=1 Tax=Escherichia coli TaxID=562 RepID=UPI001F38D0CE